MHARLTTFLAALAVLSSSFTTASALPRVHPGVHRALRKDGTVDLILDLAQTTDATLESVKEGAYATRTAKIADLKGKLQTQHKLASSQVTKLLTHESDGLHEGFKTFWISNQVFITSASFELVEKLVALDSIGDIREQFVTKVDKPELTNATDVSSKELVGYEWGVAKIGAPKVWADGNIGQGVVVASLDSGVRWTHEALKRNFRGAYGWYDPELQSAEPYDLDGHGTHTMGTIAGAKGVGVAPGATWMSCKICRVDDCPESDILECAQFMLCPTDTQGNNPDCSKAPHIVSNSWGFYTSATFFKPAVDAWTKAGIVPVFAIGNGGPECKTAASPADFPNSIAVGATGVVDDLAPFSSKGPGLNGRRKPDIVAPGRQVRSSFNTGDAEYALVSGTSMAAPHVAGAIALILSAQPDFTVEEIKVALYTTTDQARLESTNYTCGGTSDKVWPNNQYGHGRLNVLSAYEGFRPAQ